MDTKQEEVKQEHRKRETYGISNKSSFPRKRDSIFLLYQWNKIKLDSRFRGNDGTFQYFRKRSFFVIFVPS